MQRIQDDPDIREENLGLEDKLTTGQVDFVAKRLRDLIDRYKASSTSRDTKPRDWPEWGLFIDAAYCCGFVCRDAGEFLDAEGRLPVRGLIDRLQKDPSRVEDLSLRELRQILHFIMRDERWSDQGQDTSGGPLWSLISSRLGDAIARRMTA